LKTAIAGAFVHVIVAARLFGYISSSLFCVTSLGRFSRHYTIGGHVALLLCPPYSLAKSVVGWASLRVPTIDGRKKTTFAIVT
jgi:hypothetical protein